MIPQSFTVTSSIGCFYFLVFSVLHFLVVVSVRQIKLTHVGFRAHVKIASRIVSYALSVPPRSARIQPITNLLTAAGIRCENG